MGDGGGGGDRVRSWYVSREEIERRSPSRRDGVGAAKEAELRATYCCFIRDVCIGLQLPQITFATAIVLCHRFYLLQSHAKNEWQTVATVCVFLASKIEDTPCSLKRVVIVAYETMYRKNPDASKRIQQEEVLAKQKALILVGETLLLSTIRFDFDIQHPYGPLKLALNNLGISQKEVRQAAMKLINDTLPTTLVLQFKPHLIAAGSLILAAKSHNIVPPSQNGGSWWNQFDVAPKQLQAVVQQMEQQMAELFKKRDPCSMGPVIMPVPTPTLGKQQIKPTPSPTLMDKQQIKPTPTPTLMDRQQIISNPDPAQRHTQSSRRSFSNIGTEASRCVPVGSFDKKSTSRSARNEENRYRQMDEENRCRRMDEETRCRRMDEENRCWRMDEENRYRRDEENRSRWMDEENRCRRTDEENRSRRTAQENRCRRTDEENWCWRTHINHNLDIGTVEQRLEEQSRLRTLKADCGYPIHRVSKDMNATMFMDLSRQKKRIRDVEVYMSDTYDLRIGSWKKQKFERR